MKRHFFILTLSSLVAFSTVANGDDPSSDIVICTDAFSDGVKHYRDGSGITDYGRYEPTDIEAIARNILLHQRANGGWPSNWDPLRILTPEEADAVTNARNREDATFDNRATYPQTAYLAQAYAATGETAFRDGALAGLAFILEAQYDCGGWPHSYPNQQNYRPHITFMDDVMTGILTFLRSVLTERDTYAFIPDTMQERIADAVRQGDRCILQLQIVVDGVRTAWAGQYDRVTLEPTQARAYELPAIVSAESVQVMRYLMAITPPDAAIMASVLAAAAWFEKAQLHGFRIETITIEPVRYEHHTASTDRVVVADPDAPPIWARFYEIETNRPFMANRDGVKVYALADVAHERRTGYGWYSYAPAALLNRDYPAWRAKWETILPGNASN